MSQPAITVEGLGKRYRLGKSQTKPANFWQALGGALITPFRYLIRSATQASEQEILWALRGVSFTVQAGEALGVVGRNGAGKTTLLKILSRITDPTEGRARLHGRVGSLLEVGTGFHPELTGRENIFLNGAILGMHRAEISSRFDEIVDFAEVERFIDTPVKYYSSGMYVRLAFSVAAHLNPEILLVDEVLAVGDLAFQKKCLGKMGNVATAGRTILLVSHNMEAILGLCSRAIWIDDGGLVADGPSSEVVEAYTRASMDLASSTRMLERTQEGDGHLRFTGFSLRDAQGRPLEFAFCGQEVELVIDYVTKDEADLRDVAAWLWIRDRLGKSLAIMYTRLTGQNFERMPGRGRMVCRLPRLTLAPGSYLVDLAAQAPGQRSDKLIGAAMLEVSPGDFFGSGKPVSNVGMFLVDHSWRLEA